jgi:hypothetical protein
MNVNVSTETEKALKEIAARNGQDVADYAAQVLEQDVKEKQIKEYEIELCVAPARALEQDVEEKKSSFEIDEDPRALERAIERMKNRTPEEIEAARANAIEQYKPECPLPEGKTIFDVVYGQWPGDETDEEVAEALERLS